MKRYISMLLLVVTCVLSGHAVTDREMEEAKAITAKLYLRYANNGSDYLDKVNAVTMADLEKRLKPKEKENIKSFKAVSVPGDYAGWDKDQLVRYWSETFFASPGLIAKGKVAKSSVRKRLSSMNVTAPSVASSSTPTPAPTPAAPAASKPTDTKPADTKPANTKPATSPAPATVTPADISADSAAARAIAEAEAELLNLDNIVNDEPAGSKKQNSYTWVYILILCGLVAVVVGLVVFASRVLKSQNSNNDDDDLYDKPIDKPQPQHIPTVGSASLVAPELTEWRDRARQAENERDVMSEQCNEQRKRIAALTARINQLEQELATDRSSKASVQTSSAAPQATERQAASESKRQAAADSKRQPSSTESKRQANSETKRQAASTDSKRQMPEPESIVNPDAASAPQPRPTAVIYLGRVNNKGIFVRADRNLKPEASVYRLETNDGYAGTFRVANNTEVWERALANPDHVLSGGCVCTDITATSGKKRILTESSGTAVFEGGCWKVVRKAKIGYQ
ncbi:MAG: hypothetical protein K2H47_01500 [Muribaculaceae bacterium]|nr:hypothetical protein [Muribaculaceae bacterium]